MPPSNPLITVPKSNSALNPENFNKSQSIMHLEVEMTVALNKFDYNIHTKSVEHDAEQDKNVGSNSHNDGNQAKLDKDLERMRNGNHEPLKQGMFKPNMKIKASNRLLSAKKDMPESDEKSSR